MALSAGTVAAQDLRLVSAVQQQDPAGIDQFLDEGVDVNVRRADGATALLWAAHWNDHTTATRLLDAGANPNAAEDQGVTPLGRAAENTSLEMVSRLLDAGADPNQAQANGLTPRIIAAGTGHGEVIDALLAAGTDVNARTGETGQTPLMWATANQHHPVMRTLLAAGANVEAQSELGFTPLLFAVRNDDLHGARMLLEAGADVNHPGSDSTHALALAVVSGHTRFVDFLLAQGAAPNSTMHAVSALHAAAGSIDVWIRDWLRTRYAGVGLGGRQTVGLPASDRLGVVRTLLDAGADPNSRIEVFTTMEAWVSGKNGARDGQAIGTGDLTGATPLWVAAFRANRESLMYINNGRLPPPEVALREMPEEALIVEALLEAGTDPTLATADGTSPLMVAAGLGHSTFVRADESLPSASAEAAVRMLIEAGADVNRRNEADFTPLHGAAFRGLTAVAEYLIEQGAKIDAMDFRQRTALSIAQGTQQGFYVQEWPGLAVRLIELGADPEAGLGGRDVERDLSRRRTEGNDQP